MKYPRFILHALSLAIIISSATFCVPSSSGEEFEEFFDTFSVLLLTEDSGFIINSSDMDFCMEILQKVFEDQKNTLIAGSPHISPNKDMIFIPFRIGRTESMQQRYIVMHKNTRDSLIWAHNHSEESFLGLMKGLYDTSFHFVPEDL